LQAEPIEEVEALRAMTMAQERSSALILANELRIQAQEILADLKRRRSDERLELFMPIGMSMPLLAVQIRELNEPTSGTRADSMNIVNWGLLCVALSILIFRATKQRRRKRQAQIRADYLLAISDHINNAKGNVTSPAIRDLIDYAVQHGKNEDADVKTFLSRLVALRALEAAMPLAEKPPAAQAPS